jgi:hypothetical protein
VSRPLVSRASILILALFLVGYSLAGRIPDELLSGQVLRCGLVGLVAFVGLLGAARVCNVMADPPVPEKLLSPAQQSLYDALEAMGLPTDRPHPRHS